VVTTKEESDPDEPKPGVNDVDPVIPKDPDKYLARWLHSHRSPRRPSLGSPRLHVIGRTEPEKDTYCMTLEQE
jgi:hypothetical protein